METALAAATAAASPRAGNPSACGISASTLCARHRTRSPPSQSSNCLASGIESPSRKSPSTSAAAPGQSPRAYNSAKRSQSSVTPSAPRPIWSTSACTSSSPRARRKTRSASLNEWRACFSSRSLQSNPTRCSRVRRRRGLRARYTSSATCLRHKSSGGASAPATVTCTGPSTRQCTPADRDMASRLSGAVRCRASAGRFRTRMQPPPLEDVQRAIGDRYELLSSVGAGGMGFVYSARHVTLGHVVAVKVLPPEVAASEMRMRRFQQEAALAASLAHPHIVPVYDFGVRAGITFLIMPFGRGPTLERSLAQERPSLDAALRVAREIGAALDHAHGRGVVHRDVKPSNILIDDDSGRALLTDFGVAHVVRVATSPLTAPGVPIGTPDYMAPEQAAGEERLDGRADLYSLAVVTFETLTGTRPAQGSDRATLARALRGARPELPPPVAAALVAPLAPQPDERPRTVAAGLAAVDRARARLWRPRGAP